MRGCVTNVTWLSSTVEVACIRAEFRVASAIKLPMLTIYPFQLPACDASNCAESDS